MIALDFTKNTNSYQPINFKNKINPNSQTENP